MATTKKKPATKTTTSKTAPKTVKAPVRKAAPKKTTTAKKTKVVEATSFRPAKEQTPFMSFTFTKQSLYWLILSVLVLALGAWVMYLNVQIQGIYDRIEINSQNIDAYVTPSTTTKQ